MKDIQVQIYKIPDYAHIVQSVPINRTYNWVGSALNRVMCVYENNILHSVISVVNREHLEIASLMFDGLMVYGNHYDNDELLTKIEEKVNEDFDGLNMKFAYKEHNNDIIVPDDFVIPNEKDVVDTVVAGVTDDKNATETLFKLYPHWVFCEEVLYVFDKETGLWNTDHTSHLKIIQQFSDKLHILKYDNKSDRMIRTDISYGNTLSLMEKLPTLIKTLCKNENWLKQKQYSSLGKILFLNGYYDCKEQKFYPKVDFGFNPEILFMGRIHHDFEPFDENYMDSIKRRLFYDALGTEQGDYLILNLARGLAGDLMK
jgi:hypothetical protein